MKPTSTLIFMFVWIFGSYALASEQTICEADIEVTKTHEFITTQSRRLLVIADIKADENSFSCKGLGKRNTKCIFDEMRKKKTSIELNIEKKYYTKGALFHAEYIYPDDVWYITKRLDVKTKTSKDVTRYKGALFSVYYPSSFTPKPLEPYSKKWKLVETDEAHFLSPDKEVEFFVYSPHWSGEPKEYHKVAKNEVLVSKNLKASYPSKNRRISIRYATIKAKDGSYLRSYAFKMDCTLDKNGSPDSCQSDTFGIKYKNKKAYKRYKKDYIKFKKSLEKYAAS